MIKVRKGNNEFIVSKKTYEDTFKKLGYSIVKEKKVGVASTAIPTKDTIEQKLIETEKKENELKNNDKDVITSKELTSPIETKIEEDFGFNTLEEKKEETNEKKETSQDLYASKLEALKKEEDKKTRR